MMSPLQRLEVGDRVRANDKAPTAYRGRMGRVTEIGPGDDEYRVEFEDGQTPTTGYLGADCVARI